VRDNVTPEEWANTWVKIRSSATYATTSLNVNGTLSGKARKRLLDLIEVLEKAKPAIERQLTIENQYEDATEIFTITEWIQQKLN
jgi:hypothetical protein